MKDFTSWGIKIRKNDLKNYFSIWCQLKTWRLDMGPEVSLDPDRSEFYDVGITERCNAMCPFCYVEADSKKKDYQGICEIWKSWMDTFPKDIKITPDTDNETLKELFGKPKKGETLEENLLHFLFQQVRLGKLKACFTEKPLQIAVGAVGEPTVHPEFSKFLETVYSTNVVPNYTTNGIILSNYDTDKCREILDATSKYCGGVAVSFGNKVIRDKAEKAIENLIQYGNCKVMIHHIISDKNSVDEFIQEQIKWKNDIHYHVLLPLMAHGRSNDSMNSETYLYLSEQIKKNNIQNVAFGANFAPFMKENPGTVDVWEYPKEIYSKNILLKDGKVVITPSSFNLNPIKSINI